MGESYSKAYNCSPTTRIRFHEIKVRNEGLEPLGESKDDSPPEVFQSRVSTPRAYSKKMSLTKYVQPANRDHSLFESPEAAPLDIENKIIPLTLLDHEHKLVYELPNQIPHFLSMMQNQAIQVTDLPVDGKAALVQDSASLTKRKTKPKHQTALLEKNGITVSNIIKLPLDLIHQSNEVDCEDSFSSMDIHFQESNALQPTQRNCVEFLKISVETSKGSPLSRGNGIARRGLMESKISPHIGYCNMSH